jgi:hypothetical protein
LERSADFDERVDVAEQFVNDPEAFRRHSVGCSLSSSAETRSTLDVGCTYHDQKMTGQQQTSRRHHTVPLFYLRGFADADTLLTVQLPDRRFKQSVRNVSVANDFYALAGHEDGDDVLERAMSEVEGNAAAVIRKIEGGVWPLEQEDRETLAFFIALQSTRTQSQRRTADSLAAQMARLQIGAGGLALFKRQLEESIDGVTDDMVDRMWAQAMRPEGPPIRVRNVEFAQQMLETAAELVRYLSGRPWVLVRFDRRSLITSDHPVSLVRRTDSLPGEGVGYATAWGITMPLTRKLGLIMGDPTSIMNAVPVERVWAGELDAVDAVGTTKSEQFLNLHTISSASTQLFLHPGDERFLPEALPDPEPVSMQMSSSTWNFSGEPWGGAQNSGTSPTRSADGGSTTSDDADPMQ